MRHTRRERARARLLALPLGGVLLAFSCTTTEQESVEGNVTVGGAREAGPAPDASASVDGSTGRDAATTRDSGDEARPYPVGRCPEGLPGPPLVSVPHPHGTYCIDATEVTRGQYQEFVEAGYATQVGEGARCDGGSGDAAADACGESLGCEGNVYEPTERLTWPPPTALCHLDGTCPEPEDLGCTWWLTDRDDYPINCIDWCDAAGYCEWAGKRLCGDVPGTHLNELVSACEGGWDSAPEYPASSWPRHSYPYGGWYDPVACNTDAIPSDATWGPALAEHFGAEDPYDGLAPVGALETCEGGYPGLFDLDGNVWELTDECHAGSDDTYCTAYGAYYGSITWPWATPSGVSIPPATCGSSTTVGRTTPHHAIGFRCCADALADDP